MRLTLVVLAAAIGGVALVSTVAFHYHAHAHAELLRGGASADPASLAALAALERHVAAQNAVIEERLATLSALGAAAAGAPSALGAAPAAAAPDDAAAPPAAALAPPAAAALAPPPPPPSTPYTFAHIVNPIPDAPGAAPRYDQQVTLASLAAAAAAAAASDGTRVQLLTVEYAHHAPVARPPGVFESAPPLAPNRTAYKLYGLQPPLKERNLPMLSDILDAAYRATSPSTEFLLFSNADIGVQPTFYAAVKQLLGRQGGVAINRVEITTPPPPRVPVTEADLEAIYKLGRELPQGHPGYDMFVFRRSAVPLLRLYMRGVFVGYPPVGAKFVDALKCAAPGFKVVSGAHLTFHLGTRNGGWSEETDYEYYNRKAAKWSEAGVAAFAASKPPPPPILRGGAWRGEASPRAVAAACAKSRSGALDARIAAELLRKPFVDFAKPEAAVSAAPAAAAPPLPPPPPPGAAAAPPACAAAAGPPPSKPGTLYLASSGRVGSTMLAQVIGRRGIAVVHTHWLPSRVAEKLRPSDRVVFVYGDPVATVLSLRQRDLDTGDSFFGKNFSWVRKHFENMEMPGEDFNRWSREEYFSSDVLGLAAHFDAWHRPQPFPMFSLRYETERDADYMAQLGWFLGLPTAVALPAPHVKVAGSRGKVGRSDRLAALSAAQRAGLQGTYGPIQARQGAAPDACVWGAPG